MYETKQYDSSSQTQCSMEKSHRTKTIPQLSHLQFAVLEVLGTVERSGKDLRSGLSELGISKSGPAFYQLMARLEEARFVEGWYTQRIIDGQIVKERHYRICGEGLRKLRESRMYYNSGPIGQMAAVPVVA
jgi:DNA-binding PadR family transcriptional regulator